MSSRAPIGHLVMNAVPMAFNQGCKGFVASTKLLSDYLYFWLMAEKEQLQAIGTGATFKEVSAKKLKALLLPLPPQSEQRRIVSLLDAAFTRLDAAEAKVQRMGELAEDHRDAWIQQILSAEHMSSQEVAVSSVSENLDRMRIPVSQKDRRSGDVPYYGASGAVDFVDKAIFNENLLLVSEDGANLLARTKPIAFSISGPSWVNNHAHVLRFHDSGTRRWVEHSINAMDVKPWVTGAAQPKLTQRALSQLKLYLPCSEEMSYRLQLIDALDQHMGQLKRLHQHQQHGLTRLRQSLLHHAFRGTLGEAGVDAAAQQA